MSAAADSTLISLHPDITVEESLCLLGHFATAVLDTPRDARFRDVCVHSICAPLLRVCPVDLSRLGRKFGLHLWCGLWYEHQDDEGFFTCPFPEVAQAVVEAAYVGIYGIYSQSCVRATLLFDESVELNYHLVSRTQRHALFEWIDAAFRESNPHSALPRSCLSDFSARVQRNENRCNNVINNNRFNEFQQQQQRRQQ